jgi:hypothetical protein
MKRQGIDGESHKRKNRRNLSMAMKPVLREKEAEKDEAQLDSQPSIISQQLEETMSQQPQSLQQ